MDQNQNIDQNVVTTKKPFLLVIGKNSAILSVVVLFLGYLAIGLGNSSTSTIFYTWLGLMILLIISVVGLSMSKKWGLILYTISAIAASIWSYLIITSFHESNSTLMPIIIAVLLVDLWFHNKYFR